jgi:exodeoxyribonuclease VII large subunit
MAHKIYTVSEITKYIKRLFTSDKVLDNLYLSGEISNFYHHNSGHMYFTIKDDSSAMSAIMFKSKNQQLKFALEDGLQVTAHGSVNVYKPRGEYQLYVEEIEPKGKGSLYLAFEQLKEKLEKEGLFSPEEKKPIPILPKKVGIVTSPTGAAIRDILSVVKRRFENTSILVVPSHVQGDRAAPEIIQGIEYLNQRDDIDVIIISRGGGSLEDLWSFNEEQVARKIYESQTPVLSGVGHETDFTIADFVADLRAPTPSAAAELAISNRIELQNNLSNLSDRLVNNVLYQLKSSRYELESLAEKQVFSKPEQLFANKLQKLDSLSLKLEWEIKRKINGIKEKYNLLSGKLDTLSPLKTINRGYSVLHDEQGKMIKSIGQVKKGDSLANRLADGIIYSSVDSIEKKGDLNE